MKYEFTNSETGLDLSLTSLEMISVLNTLKVSMVDLAEMLTGLTVDSYADLCDTLDPDETEDDDYQLCRAFHRIINVNLIDVDCEDAWLESLTLIEA